MHVGHTSMAFSAAASMPRPLEALRSPGIARHRRGTAAPPRAAAVRRAISAVTVTAGAVACAVAATRCGFLGSADAFLGAASSWSTPAALHRISGGRGRPTARSYGRNGYDSVAEADVDERWDQEDFEGDDRDWDDGYDDRRPMSRSSRRSFKDDLQVGQKLIGKVVQFSRSGGAFVDINYFHKGFLHLDEIVGDGVVDASQALQLGQKVDVWVKRLRPDGGVELTQRNYEQKLDKLRKDQQFRGKVVHFPSCGGVFVDIGAMRQGYVPRAEMSKTRFDHETEIVQLGDEIDVWVKRMDKIRGLKLTMIAPRVPVSRLVKPELNQQLVGEVTDLSADGGAYVNIGAQFPGYIHISELVGDVRVGQKVTAWVKAIADQTYSWTEAGVSWATGVEAFSAAMPTVNGPVDFQHLSILNSGSTSLTEGVDAGYIVQNERRFGLTMYKPDAGVVPQQKEFPRLNQRFTGFVSWFASIEDGGGAFLDIGIGSFVVLPLKEASEDGSFVRDIAEVLTPGERLDVYVTHVYDDGNIFVRRAERPGAKHVGEEFQATVVNVLESGAAVLDLGVGVGSGYLPPQRASPTEAEKSAVDEYGSEVSEMDHVEEDAQEDLRVGDQVTAWIMRLKCRDREAGGDPEMSLQPPTVKVETLRIGQKFRGTLLRFSQFGGAQFDIGTGFPAFTSPENTPHREAAVKETDVWITALSQMGVWVTVFDPSLKVGNKLKGKFFSYETDGLMFDLGEAGVALLPYDMVPDGLEVVEGDSVDLMIHETGLPPVVRLQEHVENSELEKVSPDQR